jgi:hypothetical protein
MARLNSVVMGSAVLWLCARDRDSVRIRAQAVPHGGGFSKGAVRMPEMGGMRVGCELDEEEFIGTIERAIQHCRDFCPVYFGEDWSAPVLKSSDACLT